MKNLLMKSVLVMVSMLVAGAAFVPSLWGADIESIHFGNAKIYWDGTLYGYGYDVGVEGTGLTSVAVTPPGKSSIALTNDGGDWNFHSSNYPTLAGLRTDYPLGDYFFSFNGGADSVTISYNVAEFGDATGPYPVVTYPSQGAIDVPLTPTFTWESWDNETFPILALGMSVLDKATDENLYANVPEWNTALTEWTPGPLAPNVPYMFGLSAIAADVDMSAITDGGDSFESYASFESGNHINFSTAAIPEPSTLLLLGSGLLGIALRKRRRN